MAARGSVMVLPAREFALLNRAETAS
jgi:hypothetical protein